MLSGPEVLLVYSGLVSGSSSATCPVRLDTCPVCPVRLDKSISVRSTPLHTVSAVCLPDSDTLPSSVHLLSRDMLFSYGDTGCRRSECDRQCRAVTKTWTCDMQWRVGRVVCLIYLSHAQLGLVICCCFTILRQFFSVVQTWIIGLLTT